MECSRTSWTLPRAESGFWKDPVSPGCPTPGDTAARRVGRETRAGGSEQQVAQRGGDLGLVAEVWGHPPAPLTPRESLMAREQVMPDFPHTTFSVRILKVGCESLAPQPSCGEGVLTWMPPEPHRVPTRASPCPLKASP